MARPMPDIAVLLVQVMDFIADSEAIWRRMASGTEDVVANDPIELGKMLSRHAVTRIDLETIEQMIATREEVVRDVFRSQVGVCCEISALLCALADGEINTLRRTQMVDMSATMQRMGRQLANTALNVDTGVQPRLSTPASPGWTPRIVASGAEGAQ